VDKAFSKNREEGDSSIIDGLGRIKFFEQGDDYPILP
jgi:hypothetical protein